MSLPSAIASLSSTKRSTVSSGPNVSSRTTRMPGGSRRARWGGRSSPWRATGRRGGTPPASTRAPSSRADATKSSILARCAAETSGPVWLAGSSPLPIRIASARVASSATSSSATDSSTISRAPAEQTWPECRKTAVRALSTTVSKSASANTMLGFLPPSSTATRFTVSADARMIAWPVARPPVKLTMSTSGCAVSGAPTAGPVPSRMLTTPGGTPGLLDEAHEQHRRERRDLARLDHAVVQPATRAGASFHDSCRSG